MSLQDLFKAKLKSSGLSLEDAKRLKFQVIENPQTLENHFHNVPAFTLPYLDTQGKETGFYRIRYLTGTKKGFHKVTSDKDQRYDQPALLTPQLYVPNLLPKNEPWRAIFDNPEVPIVITEGELKAACAVRNGIPCLALGGVWNFKSKKQGLFRLPVFDEINFKERPVLIIFDSDSATNPQVLHAQYKFAEELFNAGAQPIIVDIPKEEGRKHGIDDYIVEYGAHAFKELITNEENHKTFAFAKELLKMNSELAVVHKPVAVMHFETSQLLDRSTAAMLYANYRMIKQKMAAPTKKELEENPNAKPSIKYSEASTFDEWLQWENRGAIYAPVYEPGQDKFTWEDGKRFYNTWTGWGAKPIAGDVKLWHWLLDQIFKNAEPEHRKWFEQWCAYPLQNPGVKMYSCPIFFGQQKGTGKSLLGLTLMSIYGANGAEITDTQLEDERNVFAAEKQFVLANEVTGSDKRTMVGRLRNLITQHTVVINKKYQPDYTIRDTINYFFTSNHIDAVYMEDDERRFFVHEVLGPKLVEVDQKKVQAYDKWLKSGDAAANVFHYLLNIDLKGFDPTAPAPNTESKQQMVEAGRSEIEAWCFKLKEDPDTCLRVGNTILKYSLWRLKDLVDMYTGDGLKKPYEKTMLNALRKAGFEKVGKGNSCPTKDGKINLWIIRNEKELKGLSAKEAGTYYDNERDINSKPKKFEKGAKK